ncbi:zinc finger protein CONSTANS-LIKE 16-like [Rhododendron vialii]|uniref:zinc finger protein CONSTANS-LIKE 16-like n=1 Tax=Rhododendron vialii TaxID=182163 RepID=UPI00265F81C2|nr:zinc finger protein CONSTANS-LIKE 16-like [Rhododendron vialii]
MVSNKKLANAVGGKTARACDNCIRKRARWYCTADDAFLCQSCDSSVHSANPLARRHQRVRLQTASSPEKFAPTWDKGFTKKARTPRNGKRTANQNLKSEESVLSSDPLVPELGDGENSNEENYEEQLVYRVPTLDPFETSGDGVGSEYGDHDDHGNNLHGLFVPSEMELAEFAADVENLLGFEEESFGMEVLGLSEHSKERDIGKGCLDAERVKVEDEEGDVMENHDYGMAMEPFEFNFDYDSSAMCEEEEANIKVRDRVRNMEGEGGEFGDVKKKKKMKLLRLDYKGVMMAWDSQKSPWTGGDRPELDPSECWPHCMGSCGSIHHDPFGGITGGIGGGYSALMTDGGREARVSRYREKRRTRLFSKKIRYEVRKLNAEKRPRMKGRFVKRVGLVAGPAAFPMQNG